MKNLSPILFNDLKSTLIAADGIALFIDKNLTVTYCTPRAAKLLQITAADGDQPLANFADNIGYPDLLHEAQTVLTTFETKEQKVELKPKSYYRIRIVADENGEELVIAFRRANAEDIEEQTQLEQEVIQRKQAEADLRQSRLTASNRLAEIEFIYNTAPVGLCVLDTDFRFVRINERLAEINGLSVEDHLGKTVREILPDLADEAEAALQKIVDSGEPVLGLEIRGETPAQPGVERVWLENWLPYKNQQGKVIGVNIVAEEVTEQRKMKLAAQESEERYTQLFNALDDGFCVCQVLINEHNEPYDYRFIEVNPAFETHTGLKNALGKTAYTLIPNLEKHWLETYAKVALEREPIRFEQGSAEMGRWFDVYSFPFGLPEKKTFAIQFKDITQRKQAEEAVKVAKEEAEQQRAQIQSLLEQAPVAIMVLRGTDYIVELVNPTGAEVWGEALSKAIGRPLFKAASEAKKQRFKKLLDEVVRTGEPFIGHEVPITLNQPGRPAIEYFNFVHHPWRNQEGKINGVISVATNATEQVLSRQSLESKNRELEVVNNDLNRLLQEQYKLTALLNNSSDFIGLATSHGVPVYVNSAGLQMVGLTEDQKLSELNISDFFLEEDLTFVNDTIVSTALKTGRWVGEYRFRNFKTGKTIPVLYNLFTVNDPATNELIGLATITIDITERKQAEAKIQQTSEEMEVLNEELVSTNEELIRYNEELSKTNEKLRQANSDLDNFVYMASHDLKTPISNIEGLVNILKRSLTPDQAQPDRVQRLLAMMQASVSRFKSTLTELAQIARLQRETAKDVVRVPLRKVIDEVQLDLAMQIEEAEAQIDTDIDSCLEVKFSARNLRSIVYNLLSNAIKYRSPDRLPQISIVCEETNDYQILSVIDNGLGMDTVDEKKVFGMFQRLHDHVEGTGVGLYITKKIVESAGGKITVESEAGIGTTFKVYFPG